MTDNNDIVELDDSIFELGANFNNNNNNQLHLDKTNLDDFNSKCSEGIYNTSSVYARNYHVSNWLDSLNENVESKVQNDQVFVKRPGQQFIKPMKFFEKKLFAKKKHLKKHFHAKNATDQPPFSEKIKFFDTFFSEKERLAKQSVAEILREKNDFDNQEFKSDSKKLSEKINSEMSKKLKSLGDFISENSNFSNFTRNFSKVNSSYDKSDQILSTKSTHDSNKSVATRPKRFLRISASERTLDQAKKLNSKCKKQHFYSVTKLSNSRSQSQVSRTSLLTSSQIAKDSNEKNRIESLFKHLYQDIIVLHFKLIAPLDLEQWSFDKASEEKCLLERYLFLLDWNFGSSGLLKRNLGYVALRKRYHFVCFILQQLKSL
jgi:hypothetical protein